MTEAVLNMMTMFPPLAPPLQAVRLAAEDPFQISYQESRVFTASREELVLMLYDGALKFTNRGLEALRNGDRPAMNYNLLRAQKIVHYLDMSLNMQQGEEVAKNLARLYDFIKRRLGECQRSQEREPGEEALSILKHMRETWQQAFELKR
ncbi:MAG: flagellar export chaperone FliS [candidate division FCPU426 bacterium]